MTEGTAVNVEKGVVDKVEEQQKKVEKGWVGMS